ncbi:dTDP-glucose 4,6-dehydratase [Alphaproteobacteria bacterium]|nr:dTDP-glucose 4,6-dehydratase [Alphaproteobacteria bacterium]
MSLNIKNNILITGGLGFIGSNFIYFLEKYYSNQFNLVLNLDLETYSANIKNLDNINLINLNNVHGNINDTQKVRQILKNFSIDKIIHFAAESHVDKSIVEPDVFMKTNILGTYKFLKTCKNYFEKEKEKNNFKFIHVSTDEVFGSLDISDPPFKESNPYAPNSPYAASKASSDLIVRSFIHTYDFPAIITNCSNNYGPFQYPEKLIPLVIHNCLNGKPIPVYGDGQQIRDWLYVEDHCEALMKVINHGKVGQRYNIGGNQEVKNIDLIKMICQLLNELHPSKEGPYEDLISFVKDRPGHDQRYAIDNTKIKNELDWSPSISLATGLKKTIQWYLANDIWLRQVQQKEFEDWTDLNYQNR